MHINIVIPTLNEEVQLEKHLVKIMDFLSTTSIQDNYTITIADNGSTDQTVEIARKMSECHECINYFAVSSRGVGLAFREAIHRTTSDIVGYMDLDLATDMKHLIEVYDAFIANKSLAIVGSRLLPGSKVEGRSLKREISSRTFNFIMRLLLRVKFHDAMCGFKFYKADVAKTIAEKCSKNNGWFWCAEMMVRCEWDGISILEIPVKWTDDPNSKVKLISLSLSYLKEILKLFREKLSAR